MSYQLEQDRLRIFNHSTLPIYPNLSGMRPYSASAVVDNKGAIHMAFNEGALDGAIRYVIIE